MVLADNGVDVIGFVTISVGRVAARALSLQPKLPRHSAPMLRIGCLAVDKRAQGKGVGRELLAFALHLALEFAERVGLYAIVVDAKDAQAAEFYRRLHVEPTLDDGSCLFLSLSRLAKAKAS